METGLIVRSVPLAFHRQIIPIIQTRTILLKV